MLQNSLPFGNKINKRKYSQKQLKQLIGKTVLPFAKSLNSERLSYFFSPFLPRNNTATNSLEIVKTFKVQQYLFAYVLLLRITILFGKMTHHVVVSLNISILDIAKWIEAEKYWIFIECGKIKEWFCLKNINKVGNITYLLGTLCQ